MLRRISRCGRSIRSRSISRYAFRAMLGSAGVARRNPLRRTPPTSWPWTNAFPRAG
jgi:hypothetical protein